MNLTNWKSTWAGLGLVLLSATACAAEMKTISVIERGGRAYVSAAALSKDLGIAVKQIPGQKLVVACQAERCAPLRETLREEGQLLVSVESLASALSASAQFEADRRKVGFRFGPQSDSSAGTVAKVGGLAPNFRLAKLDGTPIALSDLRGKRVLINSWASWWGCRNDLPVWQKFYEKHRGDNFELLSIAVDVQGPEVVKPYTQKHGVTFPVAVDTADVFGAAFALKAIPVSFLVDEVGIVRLRGGGPSPTLLKEIESILSEPLSEVRATQPQLAVARSRAEIEQAVTEHPSDWRARLAMAQHFAAAKEFKSAIAQLEAAAKLQPGSAEIQFLWGQILLSQQQKEAAVVRLKQARDLDPDNWRIRKQIWAIEHPDKFYTDHAPDFSWQKEELAREKQQKP